MITLTASDAHYKQGAAVLVGESFTRAAAPFIFRWSRQSNERIRFRHFSCLLLRKINQFPIEHFHLIIEQEVTAGRK